MKFSEEQRENETWYRRNEIRLMIAELGKDNVRLGYEWDYICLRCQNDHCFGCPYDNAFKLI